MTEHITTPYRTRHLDGASRSRMSEATPIKDGLMTGGQVAMATEVSLDVVANKGGLRGQRAFECNKAFDGTLTGHMYECVLDGNWMRVPIEWEW